MKRSDFFKTTAAGVAALFAANWGTLAQIRQYKHADKPLLTEANLNRLVGKWQAEKKNGPFREAITNTKEFLDKYFSISPQQRETIARLSEDQWKEIQSVLQDVLEKKGTLNFKFLNINAVRTECRTEMKLMKPATISTIPSREGGNPAPRQVELKKIQF